MIELTSAREHLLYQIAAGVVTHVVAHRTVVGAAMTVPIGEGVSYPVTVTPLVEDGLIEIGDLEDVTSWKAYHSRGRRLTLTDAGRAEAAVPRATRHRIRGARRSAIEWARGDVVRAHQDEYEAALERRLRWLGVTR